MSHFKMRYARLFVPAALVTGLLTAGTLLAKDSAGLQIPADFQHWYLANSMSIRWALSA